MIFSRKFIYTTLILTTLHHFVYSNPKCIVDMCQICANEKEQVCSTCESGYYLKTYTGTEKGKTYNHCFSNSSYWWYFFGLFLALLLISLCCALSYLFGSRYFDCGQQPLT